MKCTVVVYELPTMKELYRFCVTTKRQARYIAKEAAKTAIRDGRYVRYFKGEI